MQLKLRLSLSLVCWVLLACDVGHAADLALIGAKIYPSPTATPIESGSIIVHDGRIVALGPNATVKIPRHAKVIDCKGLVITAGFWNSHVHILTPGLLHAESLSSAQIASQLEEMLTRWGFTSVFDIASVLANTNLIRHRIESGEVKGPRILTVGEPFWIKGGTPVYVRDFLQTNQISIPEVESVTQAAERARQQIHAGADGIKIFVNSIEADGILTMPLELAKVITAEAHGAGKPVFAHVANREGIEVALQSSVDILAHTTPVTGSWTSSLDGKLGATIKSILDDLKPEAAYFAEDNGERTGYIFFDMKESSQLPAIAEPWFLAFNARLTVRPAMNAKDLAEANSGIERAVKGYGKAASA